MRLYGIEEDSRRPEIYFVEKSLDNPNHTNSTFVESYDIQVILHKESRSTFFKTRQIQRIKSWTIFEPQVLLLFSSYRKAEIEVKISEKGRELFAHKQGIFSYDYKIFNRFIVEFEGTELVHVILSEEKKPTIHMLYLPVLATLAFAITLILAFKRVTEKKNKPVYEKPRSPGLIVRNGNPDESSIELTTN